MLLVYNVPDSFFELNADFLGDFLGRTFRPDAQDVSALRQDMRMAFAGVDLKA
jgi:hypothetical protein